jgi:hypothetical protein
MVQYTPDFTLEVEGIKGVCPAGEVYAKQTIAEKKIPVSPAKDLASAETSPDWLPTWWRMMFHRLRVHAMQRHFLCLTHPCHAG